MGLTKRRNPRPWGRILGLLCGCIVTLVGVSSNLDPLLVLKRAVTAGLVVGLIGAIFTALVNRLSLRRGAR